MSSRGLWYIYTQKGVTPEVPSPTSFLPAVVSKRRFYFQSWLGLFALCFLNLASGLNWLWFSSMAVNIAMEYNISLQRVNWLATCINLIYLPLSVLVPLGFNRWGMRISCTIGSLLLLTAAWVRYAGTTETLPPTWKYALLLTAQILTGCGQPWFHILGPAYSKAWFDGCVSTTMIISIATSVGAALSQLAAPTFPTVRHSVLALAIVTSVTIPTALLIHPTPSTLASQDDSNSPPPAPQILRALIGKPRQGEMTLSLRERADMGIITLLFGILVAAFTAISILTNQIFDPYGYSSDEAGRMSGLLILFGIIGAASTIPIFGHYLSDYLSLATKMLAPMAAASYIALIWSVRTDNDAGIYVIITMIGVLSFALLPVTLDMSSRIIGSVETSSTILWFSGNFLSVLFVLIMDALRDDSQTADPPSNMHKSLIFLGCFVTFAVAVVFGLRNEKLKPAKTSGISLTQPRTQSL